MEFPIAHVTNGFVLAIERVDRSDLFPHQKLADAIQAAVDEFAKKAVDEFAKKKVSGSNACFPVAVPTEQELNGLKKIANEVVLMRESQKHAVSYEKQHGNLKTFFRKLMKNDADMTAAKGFLKKGMLPQRKGGIRLHYPKAQDFGDNLSQPFQLYWDACKDFNYGPVTGIYDKAPPPASKDSEDEEEQTLAEEKKAQDPRYASTSDKSGE